MTTIQQLYSLYLEHLIVSTDSRSITPGCIFFALRGERFDGNRYAHAALEAGAAYAVVDDASLVGEQLLHVPNVLEALQALATHHRLELATPLIAITGTNGKTTTKELAAAVLSRSYHLLYTEGNLNNHIGVPLTLLRLTPEHQIALIEMGASKPGDIAELCAIAQPNYGLITNVGLAHLEGFGSLLGVIKTKGELYDWLRAHGGKIFLREEDATLRDLGRGIPSVTYGQGEEAVVRGYLPEDNRELFLHFAWSCPTLQIAQCRQSTRLVGGYNLDNALAAIAIGLYFDVPVEDISRALADYAPSNSRSQLIETEHNWLIADAYNANPSSMHTALQNLFGLSIDCPKLLVLGDMNELGAESAAAHHKLRTQVEAALGVQDRVLYCGPRWREELGEVANSFPTREELAQWLEQHPPRGYLVLVKGSNSIGLGRILHLF
ncbi:MAG: UDP-N-acetylmuramoyl-tripeptide--D-alanyl-D-alanine ligase [Porphyromonadaceae bacterium]|nr:UDP-N-acetylmuramoyl-tripeptide--D-alanyl-D-alanine ligase [Porphyromonadaceae bacterium]